MLIVNIISFLLAGSLLVAFLWVAAAPAVAIAAGLLLSLWSSKILFD